MRIPQTRRTASAMELRMTPMIDVVFLLLIFFVTTASFQAQEQRLPADLNQPGSSQATTAEPPEPDLDPIVVRLAWRNGEPAWSVNGQEQPSLAEVRAALARIAAIDAELPVVLDIAGEAPLGQMIDIYDACRLAGFERIRFAVEAPR